MGQNSIRTLVLAFLLLLATAGVANAQQLTVEKLASEGEGDGAGAGDLRLTQGCKLEVEGDGWLAGSLNIQVQGSSIESTYVEQYIYDSYTFDISTTVPASNSNRGVQCWASTSWGNANKSWQLPGSGPATALFKAAAFIRQNWVMNPFNTYRIFGGDYGGRPCSSSEPKTCGFTASDGASHRIQSSMDLYNPATSNANPPKVWGPNHTATLTTEYDKATSLAGSLGSQYLTAAAKADWTMNSTLKTFWTTAQVNSGGNHMDCSIVRLGPNPEGRREAEYRVMQPSIIRQLRAGLPHRSDGTSMLNCIGG